MCKNIRHFVIIGLLLVIIAGCGKSSASPTPIQSLIQNPAGGKAGSGTYKSTDCPFTLPQGAEEAKGECGILTVPEDRSRSNGPTIQLPVAVFKSPGANPAPEPVLFLFSNPGPVINFSWQMHFALRDMHNGYNFVFLEQRGVGLSKPSLDCPEVDGLFLKTIDQDPRSSAVVQQNISLQRNCRESLISQKINLAAYTTAASAADIEDLRLALGYQQWNIYSIGYGSRWVDELIRSYPQTIRSVIYEAVLSPESKLFLNQASYAEASINLLFKRCSDSPECDKAFPNLKNVFFDLVDQLNSHPITVDSTELSSGKTYKVFVNGNRLIDLVLMAVNTASEELLSQTPRIIFQVRDKKYEQLSASLGTYIGYATPSGTVMQNRVFCVEEMRGATDQQFLDANAKAESHIREYFNSQMQSNKDACAIWQADDVSKGKPAARQPVKSNIPSLLLGGDYPYSTPSAWMKEAAKNISRSTVVEFPGAGQVVSFFGPWSDCAHTLENAFLANPAGKLDASCAAVVKKPLWITLP
jgi:pimeloyl-ACP methyl ester carboxylesterase